MYNRYSINSCYNSALSLKILGFARKYRHWSWGDCLESDILKLRSRLCASVFGKYSPFCFFLLCASCHHLPLVFKVRLLFFLGSRGRSRRNSMLERTLQYPTKDLLLMNGIQQCRLCWSNKYPQNISVLKQNRLYVSLALRGYCGLRRKGWNAAHCRHEGSQSDGVQKIW